MKIVLICAILLATIFCRVEFEKKENYSKKRQHRNLYKNIKIADIKKIIKYDPFFMLLVGYARSALYEKYKHGMENYSLKHSINKSWLHYGFMDIRHKPGLEKQYGIKQYPVLLHFYEGQLVKKDYRFNKKLNPEVDMDIKYLHSITELFPTHKELVKLLDEYLYTFIINVHEDEQRHFDVSDKRKTKFLHKIAETVSTLPREEYQVVGINFDKLSQETIDFLHEHDLKDNSFNFDGFLLHSKESKSIFELTAEEVLNNNYNLLKDWIYHHSHGFLMTPGNAYKNIIKQKNWGLVFFHSSETMGKDDIVKDAIVKFEKMAEKFKGKISFTICDIYLEHICKRMFNHFELQTKHLPMIRILYAMEGKSSHHKVFRMSQAARQELMTTFGNDRFKAESSYKGLTRFIKDFFVFDIDLDIKCEGQHEKTKQLLDNSIELLKKNDMADLEHDRVLRLNCHSIKLFTQKLNTKDRVLLIYNSVKHKELFGEFEKLRKWVLQKVGMTLSKFIIFGAYDLHKNTRHGHSIDMKDLPIIRYYRKEEHVSNYYSERFLTSDYYSILNAVIDFSNHDMIEEES